MEGLWINATASEIIPVLLILAGIRIYLEIINFDFAGLPLTKMTGEKVGKANVLNFHKMGLFFSVGYIILFAPTYLLS